MGRTGEGNLSGKTGWHSVGAALCGLVLSACAATKQSASIDRVDDLVARVEGVHTEAELGKRTLYEAFLALRPVLTPTAGEPREQYAAFLTALAASEAQSTALEDRLAPLEQSARRVFAQWESDLRAFESDALRDRSRERLLAARSEYDAVARSAKRAQTQHAALNASLRDVSLFLAHDFNPAAIELLREDTVELRERAQSVGREYDRCMAAAETYVASAAPIGVAIAVEDNTAPVASADTPTSSAKTPPNSTTTPSPSRATPRR